MERCPTQAVLPLVGLAAEKVIRDRYNSRSDDCDFGRWHKPPENMTPNEVSE
ncbi:MAG: hypothetical protein ACQESR_18325 [Planctomycetota bacterium]